MPETPGITVRPLVPVEWPLAVPLLHLLRPHRAPGDLLPRLERLAATGFWLAAAFLPDEQADPAGIIGLRETENLHRGPFLLVEDLVTAPALQGRGVGRALVAYAAHHARERNLAALLLNARPTAIPFYQALGFVPFTSPSMLLPIAPGGLA